MARAGMRLDDSWKGTQPRANTAAAVPLPPVPAQRTTTTRPTTGSSSGTRNSSRSGSSTRRSSSSGSSSSSGGGGGGGVKKSSDKAQVAALEQLLSTGFKQALDQRLANIENSAKQGDALLMDGYNARMNVLLNLRKDNEIAEGSSSWANLTNRAREASDILTQAAAMGAGETDQLRSQLIAARNWSSNQMEVNRAYYDSLGSNNNAIVDLNADTRSARYNLANQALSDKEQAWSTYANQVAEASTQLGNIQANPYSDSYKADGGKSSWDRMVKEASTVWKNPGVSDDIRNWRGTSQARQELLNNSFLQNGPNTERRKGPEGSTLGSSWGGTPSSTDLGADESGQKRGQLKEW